MSLDKIFAPSRSRARPLLVRWLLVPVVMLVVVLAVGWGGGALWYQLQAPVQIRIVVVAMWILSGLTAMRALYCGRWRPLCWLALVFVALLGWWNTLQPSQEREWAADVARLLHVELEGNRLKLQNVRNFVWRTNDDYTVRWEAREYDLSQLVSADLVLSHFAGPAIAHTLISFGFEDGRYLTFSVEIRRANDQRFSALSGFFRQFELALVAADERDIIRVRSNVRGEDVYLYRLQLSRPILRALLLGYADKARRLEQTPSFYNTLSSNCTTIVFDLARAIAPGLRFDYRLLLSGFLGQYVFDQHVLTPGFDYATLRARGRIVERAMAAGDDPAFSRLIRVGVPGVAVRAVQP